MILLGGMDFQRLLGAPHPTHHQLCWVAWTLHVHYKMNKVKLSAFPSLINSNQTNQLATYSVISFLLCQLRDQEITAASARQQPVHQQTHLYFFFMAAGQSRRPPCRVGVCSRFLPDGDFFLPTVTSCLRDAFGIACFSL